MMKTKILLLVIIVIPFLGYGQVYKPLKVGDKVPDLALEILNGKLNKTRISAFKGKLLIIDCWNIYCGGCIEGFPKLTKVQGRFANQLNIIALEGITPKEKVLSFLSARKAKGVPIQLPVMRISSLRSSTLMELFPVLHSGFPLEIWIDNKGVFIGSTDAGSVNEQIINTVLAGKPSVLGQRQYQKDFNRDQAFLVNNNGGPDSLFTYRSLITPFIDSIPKIGTDFYTKKNSRFTRIFFANRTIADLVKIAVYRDLRDIHNQYLELDVKDPNRFISRKLPNSTSDQNTYCYELILPPDRTIEEAFNFMLEDLSRYFRIKAQILPRPKSCLVLQAITKGVMKTTATKAFYKREKVGGVTEVEARSTSFVQIMSLLGKASYPIIVDETGIDYPVDFKLKVSDNYDFENVRLSLEPLGLKITEKMVERDILVITER